MEAAMGEKKIPRRDQQDMGASSSSSISVGIAAGMTAESAVQGVLGSGRSSTGEIEYQLEAV